MGMNYFKWNSKDGTVDADDAEEEEDEENLQ